MNLRWIGFLSLACGVVLSTQSVTPTYAANIITAASGCQTTFAPSDQIGRFAYGVVTLPSTATPQMVACNLIRAPLATDSLTGSFYVDGDNFNGASTFCSLFSFDANGHLAGVASFTTALATYDMLLSMQAGRLTPFGHTTLRCLLPAHASGVLRGVTSLQ
jgi:hypothetical protein